MSYNSIYLTKCLNFAIMLLLFHNKYDDKKQKTQNQTLSLAPQCAAGYSDDTGSNW